MTAKRPGRRPAARQGDRHLRLLPAHLVPLSTEQDRQAVEALAGLLVPLLARQGADSDGISATDPEGAPTDPDDNEAA